jgi:hypothetical protein
MATILPFLRNGIYFRDSVFEPHDIEAMSRALNDVCAVLKLQDDNPAKMATRIIDLARRGERSPTRLRDRVLHEAGLAEYALEPKKPIRHPKLFPPPNRPDHADGEGPSITPMAMMASFTAAPHGRVTGSRNLVNLGCEPRIERASAPGARWIGATQCARDQFQLETTTSA